VARREEAIVMGEHEDYRAGLEARREAAAASAVWMRHDELIRRRLGSAFYDVVRHRSDHPAPHARRAEGGPQAEDVHVD
jgi:hypothetical protein